LDGVFVGWLQSAEGGYAYSDVVAEQVGPDFIQRKHIGNVKYEEITLKVGANMTQPFYQWLKDTLEGQHIRKSGSVIFTDYDSREVQRLSFTNALITEIGFPALDAASKDPAYLTIKFAPEAARRVKGSGVPVKFPPVGSKQKQWLPANFRLRIDGLERATTRINKVEALTVKQKVVTDAVGEFRDYEIEPTKLEFPNLVMTISEVDADAWYDWHESFVIQGNNGTEAEKGGRLEFLSPNLKEVLFSLQFSGLGIFKLAPEKSEAGAEQIRRVKAELYVERISLSLPVASALPVEQAKPAVPVTMPDPVPADQVRTLERGVK
jgi:phage tail-like protein